MQKEQVEQMEDCIECNKKEKLIDKYLNLIELLKKKTDRSVLSTTLKKSIDAGTTSNTSLLHSNKISRVSLAITVGDLFLRRKIKSFNIIKLAYVEGSCHKAYMFLQKIEKIISRRMNYSAKMIFQSMERGNGRLEQEGVLNDRENSLMPFDKSLSRNVSCYVAMSKIESHKKEKVKQLTRRVFELSQELQQIKFQKKMLDDQVEENVRRQEIQSKKKKQSLEMLAEEMADKNQIINELQTTLKFYQAKQGKNQNNVLEEDSFANKRELQKMEKINQKINLELEKRSSQLIKTQEQLKALQERMNKLESQHVTIKQKNFQMAIDLQNLQKKKSDYSNMSSFLQKKLTNLKKYQKLIYNNLKVIDQCSMSDRSSFNNSFKPKHSKIVLQDPIMSENNLEQKQIQLRQFSPISKFESQYKVQKILNYLFNIQLEDVWINNDQKLLDNEELAVLNQVKLKFISLNQQLKQLKKKQIKSNEGIAENISHVKRFGKESGEDQFNNDHHITGSIFEVFGSERGHRERDTSPKVNQFHPGKAGICSKCMANDQSNSEQTTRRADHGFTIKLLQMQIQKNKQVQKISELKNKLFHIRSIVMNFIKSLDIKYLKPESKDIMEVFFEFFEYSEEEKQIIFKVRENQRRLWGLF